MISDFYDSSAFAKLFLQEPNTVIMLERYRRAHARTVSRLAFLEVRSAIKRLETEGKLSHADAIIARTLLDAELDRIDVIPLNEAVLATAQQILERR